MTDRAALQQKVPRTFWRHVAAMVDILGEGEQILDVTTAGEAGRGLPQVASIVALTNRRVIFVRGLPLRKLSVADIPLAEVSRCEYSEGGMFAPPGLKKVVTISSTRSGTWKFTVYKRGPDFAEGILRSVRAVQDRRPPHRPPAPDLATRLQRLAELHRSGGLSDEEFAAAKAKLIH
jgi:hypothetical protein